jgi:Ca2+-binding RTX toxin-like protein
MRKAGLWLGGAALAAVLPAAAHAGTVDVEPSGKTSRVAVRAAAGEANRVVVRSDGATVIVRDRGAPLVAGNGCLQATANRVTCAFPAFVEALVELKGGKDRVRVRGAFLRLVAFGGPGADRITGGPRTDVLDGGAGPDVLDGRGSVDVATYLERNQGVRVTLADGKRNDGGKVDGAQRDLLRRMEHVFGGNGNDVLVGDGKVNSLFGGPGRDLLRGRGGDDDLIGGTGNDRAFGGPGDDLFPGDTGRDRSFGQGGADHFQGAGAGSGPDLFAGGKGRDTAQYSFGSVRLSLDGEANDGRCADPACTSSD